MKAPTKNVCLRKMCLPCVAPTGCALISRSRTSRDDRERHVGFLCPSNLYLRGGKVALLYLVYISFFIMSSDNESHLHTDSILTCFPFGVQAQPFLRCECVTIQPYAMTIQKMCDYNLLGRILRCKNSNKSVNVPEKTESLALVVAAKTC